MLRICDIICYSVDATLESGKLGRLLNHSRLKPNCVTKTIDIGDIPYLILVAARDIDVGEELLYDYGDRSKQALESNPWLKEWKTQPTASDLNTELESLWHVKVCFSSIL